VNADSLFTVGEAVVDASVVAKWHFPEELREKARQLAYAGVGLVAPTLLLTEVGSIFLKKSRADAAVLRTFKDAIEAIVGRIGFVADQDLLEQALVFAHGHGRSFYDSLYVALALQRDLPLITADERLVNALLPALGSQVVWLGDLPAL
jgi:predicted nucleic acid-binding protein